MIVLETERLVLRWFHLKDAPFILELVNDPAWIQYIGDKRIKNLEDAKKYILNGPVDMYNKMGFGLYLVERKEDLTPLGMCGLIKRDSLEDVDIGFAFFREIPFERIWLRVSFCCNRIRSTKTRSEMNCSHYYY